MAHVGFHWDEAAIERLRVLWLEECKTSSEIGLLMGVSRNSIIGKTHRLGWSGMRQQRPVKRKRVKKAARPPKPKAERPQIPEMRPNKQPPPKPVIGSYLLLDLKSGHCKWPEGNAPPYSYCGARALEGAPYCEPHHQRAHHGPPGPRGTPSYLRWSAK